MTGEHEPYSVTNADGDGSQNVTALGNSSISQVTQIRGNVILSLNNAPTQLLKSILSWLFHDSLSSLRKFVPAKPAQIQSLLKRVRRQWIDKKLLNGLIENQVANLSFIQIAETASDTPVFHSWKLTQPQMW
jgi:hypothetical protein